MSYILNTPMGALELPGISCCYCLYRMEFMGCTSCQVVEGFYNATKPIINEIDRKINEENNESNQERTNMTERVFPDSPFICKACGKDVDGSVTIEGKGICAKCFKKFGLEEKLGFTIEELFGEEDGE